MLNSVMLITSKASLETIPGSFLNVRDSFSVKDRFSCLRKNVFNSQIALEK